MNEGMKDKSGRVIWSSTLAKPTGAEQCDRFFLRTPPGTGGCYPCGRKLGHEGEHLHLDELPDSSWCLTQGRPRKFADRSHWYTVEEYEALPEVQAHRARIATLRAEMFGPAEPALNTKSAPQDPIA